MDDKKEKDGRKAELFQLGTAMATNAAWKALNEEEILDALSRHSRGKWGRRGDAEMGANARSLEAGGKLVSRHFSARGKRFLVVTDAGRSSTTVMLPRDLVIYEAGRVALSLWEKLRWKMKRKTA